MSPSEAATSGQDYGPDDDQPLDPSQPGALTPTELFWRRHQQWLEGAGYMLRERYRDSWRPSWIGTGKPYFRCTDGIGAQRGGVIDATRISDGALVTLKRVRKSRHPHEVEIGLFFMSEPLVSDPKNHCVPILQVLQVPEDDDLSLIVMPYLRVYYSPRFETYGEVVAFFKQVFEGLQFMHAHRIAHRDCDGRNIMMDGVSLYPEGFHPIRSNMKPDLSGFAPHYTRTQRPTRYYLIDFGISRRYNPEDGPPLEPPILGGDKSVPEFQTSDEPRDPFPTDVYYMGNMIREDFIKTKYGFEFMEKLVADMVQDDPTKRPTMDEVVTRFESIRKSLSSWKLRSRIPERDELAIIEAYRAVVHWKRRVWYVLRRIPAVPLPC
ncbi:hypothetical protein GLOTRDRAFT_137525 [Gloeophyllum trabeum ATCC 11539]|uniref:Protein kinase domain-containing protein n=1 Tax=Gloeophyllum trabeum (strain ATCC 11539 / FP-39264 / Madison 617) TaxID=670483 RepID=S7RV62_GLOTA|nr:uncharacterized protein GLOTRDRAFT_137525 [Gloeophyllum trabeum ATCC 11539]EPQ57114.1 hypothetical protein GLOTRDRAFT_137525 [Gloeophyllum trabeum ATCC 11539]